MFFERTPELENEYLAALGVEASDTDAALACGIAPRAMVRWLVEGMLPGSRSEHRAFTVSVARAVAKRRKALFEWSQTLLGGMGEVELDKNGAPKTNASAAKTPLDLAESFASDQKLTGLLGQALDQAESAQGALESLRHLFESQDPKLFSFMLECGVPLDWTPPD